MAILMIVKTYAWRHKENMFKIYSEVLFNHKEEWNHHVCTKMEKSDNYPFKSNNLERQIIDEDSVWNKKVEMVSERRLFEKMKDTHGGMTREGAWVINQSS